MTTPSPPDTSEPRTDAGRGLRESVRRVAGHASALVRLERELAKVEVQSKGKRIGAGAGIGIAAGIVLLYALGFAFAAAAATLALLVDWWLALWIVVAALLVVVVALGLTARRLIRRGTPPAPTQAVEEARLTAQALRGNRDE